MFRRVSVISLLTQEIARKLFVYKTNFSLSLSLFLLLSFYYLFVVFNDAPIFATAPIWTPRSQFISLDDLLTDYNGEKWRQWKRTNRWPTIFHRLLNPRRWKSSSLSRTRTLDLRFTAPATRILDPSIISTSFAKVAEQEVYNRNKNFRTLTNRCDVRPLSRSISNRVILVDIFWTRRETYRNINFNLTTLFCESRIEMNRRFEII